MLIFAVRWASVESRSGILLDECHRVVWTNHRHVILAARLLHSSLCCSRWSSLHLSLQYFTRSQPLHSSNLMLSTPAMPPFAHTFLSASSSASLLISVLPVVGASMGYVVSFLRSYYVLRPLLYWWVSALVSRLSVMTCFYFKASAH